MSTLLSEFVPRSPAFVFLLGGFYRNLSFLYLFFLYHFYLHLYSLALYRLNNGLFILQF